MHIFAKTFEIYFLAKILSKLRDITSHSQKSAKNYGKLLIRKKTDIKTIVTERIIDLAQRATFKKKQFFPQQIRVERSIKSEIWIGTTKDPTYMPMWTTVHTDPLSTLFQSWIHSLKTMKIEIPLRHS